ncbi:DUF6119 family protein [Levilactobacillus spicheri]|uniref:Uncharacterized protein n=1 Tax=Levilactobacillus spicheri TaxID=216463 RepID=A0A0F3RW77_9LACO|nr:DUF6119 family protein [Levilactobacillus spicheri]KJW13839.1 hypothetical protein VC81_01275 [Levilactobacillus spicheri]
MSSDKHTYNIAIRLHKTAVRKYEDVLRTVYKKGESSYIPPVTIDPSLGHGKVYIISKKTTPQWTSLLNDFAKNRVTIPDNSYSKALIVLKIKNRFMSISLGYGDSLLNDSMVVDDFGKMIAAKKVNNNMVNGVNTMTISDSIVQSSKQIVGNSSNGVASLIQSNSEFPNSIAGLYRNGSTETLLEGSGALLKAKRNMKLTEIIPDLKFYLDAYLQKGTISDWISRLKKISSKSDRDKLNTKLADQIINKNLDFGIAWPEYTDLKDLNITGLSANLPDSLNTPASQLKWYINQLTTPHPAETLLNKIKTSAHVIAYDSYGQERKMTVYRCLLAEFNSKTGRYLLFNGNWFEVSNAFYNELQSTLGSVPVSTLPLPEFKKSRDKDESGYNSYATKQLAGAVELHRNNYNQSVIHTRGSIEPADIITRQKEFLYVKKGNSSSVLSHLFMQGYVSAQLLSQGVDSNFRNTITKDASYPASFLDISVPNNKITIVFVIIRNNRNLPLFSMITFAKVVHDIKVMNFQVQIAWVKDK